jgi:hypothetical protein
MHNVPLEFWPAALRDAASTGEKIFASDKDLRWQRAVGDVVGSTVIPAAVLLTGESVISLNHSRIYQWPP